MKRIICKSNISKEFSLEKLKGLTIGKIYSVIDRDNIGYFILDDLGKESWYCRDKFLEKEEVREVSLDLLFGQNKYVNVLMNGKVVNRYMSDDVREVVIISIY